MFFLRLFKRFLSPAPSAAQMALRQEFEQKIDQLLESSFAQFKLAQQQQVLNHDWLVEATALSFVKLAVEAMQATDYDLAIAHCTQAIQLNPQDAKPYFYRSISWHVNGDAAQSSADYLQAIRLDEKLVEQDFNLICLAFEMQPYREELKEHIANLRRLLAEQEQDATDVEEQSEEE
jgi:tetratricopeptide (TPR) repeat protein